MLESLRKDKHWIEYPFGSIFYGYLVRNLRDRKIHPNVYTISFILCGILSGIYLSQGYVILSFLLWRLSIIMDLVDGAVARYQQKTSKLGEYLDNIGHIFTISALCLGGVWNAFDNEKRILALLAGICSILLVYTFKYINYTVFEERQKMRLSSNKSLVFIEKRVSDFFDTEILFLLVFAPIEIFNLFIAVKLVRTLLIVMKSLKNAW